MDGDGEKSVQPVQGVEATTPSAMTTASSIPELLEEIQASRDGIKGEIEQLSRNVAPSADTWISQAEKLQAEIQKSRATAREIVKEAEKAAKLRATREDASNKLDLLQKEVSFNKRLEWVLRTVKDAVNKIGDGKAALVQADPRRAFEIYQEVEESLTELRPLEDNTAVGLLQQRATTLRQEVVEQAEQCWHTLIHVDRKASIVNFRPSQSEASRLRLGELADLMLELNILDQEITRFAEGLDSIILRPRMNSYEGQVANIVIGTDSLENSGWKQNDGVESCIEDVTAILQFLSKSLPPTISARLSEDIVPRIVSRFTSKWLPSSIPTALDKISTFQTMLDKASKLSLDITEIGWTGGAGLDDWVEQAPRHWLSRRRESALAAVRLSLTTQLRSTKTVERIETQIISEDDVIASANATGEDDWDAGWNDEESGEVETTTDRLDDAEDVSAWEADNESEDASQETGPLQTESAGNEDDEVDAWGWDDEQKPSIDPEIPSKPITQINGNKLERQPTRREVTLRESFNVTGVPDQLRDIISLIAHDAASLRSEPYSSSAVAGAASGLLSLPTLVLAGFRALAPNYYISLDGGNMFLYNDSIRLAGELTAFISQDEESVSTQLTSKMKLDTDIASLESFARRAYAKEMDSQRTILRDLLDGAQGFTNCTQEPFLGACEAAISGTVDYVRSLADRWRPILSRSSLLQSLGSLLATVTSKIVLDFEDMSDISEPESKKLKAFCEEVSKLGALFVVQDEDSGETQDMVGLYAPSWFKFQYLAEIMESSLVDIKYLWTEGELKLEFDADEVVDLIEALFADTDHRRRAISEIRRG